MNDNTDFGDIYQVALISDEDSGKSHILLRMKEKPFDHNKKKRTLVLNHTTLFINPKI